MRRLQSTRFQFKDLFLFSFIMASGHLPAFSSSDSLDAYVDSTEFYMESLEDDLNYQTGTVAIEEVKATLTVPQKFAFLDASDAQYVLNELWGNPPDPDVLGLLVYADSGVTRTGSWAFVLFYDDIGFVKDEDAEDIDYDELLIDMQKDTKEESIRRVELGYDPIELVGWASVPHYDTEKKVLHWAKELRFSGDSATTLNYNLRILGRKGVFILNAVAGMDELPMVNANIDEVLKSVVFEQGNTYADFDPDIDQVAAYTVGGLVAGKVLAKVGFFAILAKFGKFIFIGLAAAGGWIFNLFRKRKATEKLAEKPISDISTTESNR